jgi:uncharacterized protein (DUF1501 family)
MAEMWRAPMWLARAAASEGSRRKTLVAIFMRGAADGLNIVAPFGDPRYRDVRPNLALQPPPPKDENQNNGPFGPIIDLDGMFGLNAGLRPFKELWDKKQLAIVEATGSPDPSRSHFDAQDYMGSVTPGKTGNGWLNRALGRSRPWLIAPEGRCAFQSRFSNPARRARGNCARQHSGLQHFGSGQVGDPQRHV